MIILKNKAELDKMRVAGKLSADLLNALCDAAQPGMTTGELDELARRLIQAMGDGAESAFLGYGGFPGAVCISVNEELIHGIPGRRVLQKGDLVSFDVGVKYDGFIGDNARTIVVGGGAVDANIQRLLRVTRRALELAVAAVRPGVRLSDISHLVEKTVTGGGCSVVREYVGHGVGRHLHEDPPVPNYGAPGRGPILKTGMTFCIEPMVNLGRRDVRVLDDGWTVVARDGKPNAHFEYAVAVLEDQAEILTPWMAADPWVEDEPPAGGATAG